MIDQLLLWDRELLLWINSFHTPWLDQPMLVLTRTLSWLPLYGALIYFVIVKYKRQSWVVILGAALVVLLCDQITSGLMKPYFARLRPSLEPSLEGLVHLVNGYKGGTYGFASGHAANSFGVGVFVWLTLKSHYRWAGLIFIWSAFFTYTRLYLGVHYPGDILVGGMIGALCGWGVHRLVTRSLRALPSRQ